MRRILPLLVLGLAQTLLASATAKAQEQNPGELDVLGMSNLDYRPIAGLYLRYDCTVTESDYYQRPDLTVPKAKATGELQRQVEHDMAALKGKTKIDETQLADAVLRACILSFLLRSDSAKTRQLQNYFKDMVVHLPVIVDANVTDFPAFLAHILSRRPEEPLASLLGVRARIKSIRFDQSPDYFVRPLQRLAREQSALKEQASQLLATNKSLEDSKVQECKRQSHCSNGSAQADGLVLGGVFVSSDSEQIRPGGNAQLTVGFFAQPSNASPGSLAHKYALFPSFGTNPNFTVAPDPQEKDREIREIAGPDGVFKNDWHFTLTATADIPEQLKVSPTVLLYRFPKNASVEKNNYEMNMGNVELRPDALVLRREQTKTVHTLITLWSYISAPLFAFLGFLATRWYDDKKDRSKLVSGLTEELEFNERQLAAESGWRVAPMLRHEFWDSCTGKLRFLPQELKAELDLAYDQIVRSRTSFDSLADVEEHKKLEEQLKLSEILKRIRQVIPPALKDLREWAGGRQPENHEAPPKVTPK